MLRFPGRTYSRTWGSLVSGAVFFWPQQLTARCIFFSGILDEVDVRYFEVQIGRQHLEFGETNTGSMMPVFNILVYDHHCAVTEDFMKIRDPIPVRL